MLKSEFILNFAEKYSVKNINDLKHADFVEAIKDDIYLIKNETE